VGFLRVAILERMAAGIAIYRTVDFDVVIRQSTEHLPQPRVVVASRNANTPGGVGRGTLNRETRSSRCPRAPGEAWDDGV
jgi:hypothetical protein